MIPIGDDNSGRKAVPIITYVIIGLNVLMFLLEMAGGEEFIRRWAFVPSRFLAHPVGDSLTIFTAMFMHGSLMHIGGNMLYLWIFGDNVEDRLGKISYVLFYLTCGVIATFAQLAMDPSSSIPNLGASGAIAGILGAYIVFFPQGRVNVLLGRSMTDMPALIVIGLWFVLQFLSTFSNGQGAADGGEGGVAYMAHVGGFIAGVLGGFLAKLQNPSIKSR